MKESKFDLINKFVKRNKSCTLKQIMTKFSVNRTSGTTHLKKTGALASLNNDENRNHLYILPQKYQFDDNGLLFLGDFTFFEEGTLLKVICHLIEKSPAGMGARELDKVLKTTTHTQLPSLFRKGLLTREKAINRAGNAFWYFSADPVKAAAQREAYACPPAVEVELGTEEFQAEELGDVIEVLLTVISHPDFSAKSVCISLKRRGFEVSKGFVEQVFSRLIDGKKNY